jgi:hypothetical protein
LRPARARGEGCGREGGHVHTWKERKKRRTRRSSARRTGRRRHAPAADDDEGTEGGAMDGRTEEPRSGVVVMVMVGVFGGREPGGASSRYFVRIATGMCI